MIDFYTSNQPDVPRGRDDGEEVSVHGEQQSELGDRGRLLAGDVRPDQSATSLLKVVFLLVA